MDLRLRDSTVALTLGEFHGLNPGDAEQIGACGDCDSGGRGEKWKKEAAGFLHYPAGEPGRGDSGEMRDAVLDSGPPAGGGGSGESLRDGEDIRRVHAETDACQDEQSHGGGRVVDDLYGEKNRSESQSASGERFPDARR